MLVMLNTSEVASETVTECAMVAREMKARRRALMSILCERVSTSLVADLTQDFVDEFCFSIAQNVIRYISSKQLELLIYITMRISMPANFCSCIRQI